MKTRGKYGQKCGHNVWEFYDPELDDMKISLAAAQADGLRANEQTLESKRPEVKVKRAKRKATATIMERCDQWAETNT